MPIFEYRCAACEHEFEELIRGSEDERALMCPSCGKRGADRKLSVFSAPATVPGPKAQPGGCGRCGDPNGSCGM